MHVTFMSDRHYFVNLKKSITVIQQAIRVWISQRHYKANTICNQRHNPDLINVASVIQSCNSGQKMTSVYAQKDTLKEKGSVMSEEDRVDDLQTTAAIIIQNSWNDYVFSKSIRSQHTAATKIQSHYRGWLRRKSFARKKQAVRTIQRSFQCSRTRRDFQIHRKENVSAVIIQSDLRGWMARREAYREKNLFIRIQVSCFRMFSNVYSFFLLT